MWTFQIPTKTHLKMKLKAYMSFSPDLSGIPDFSGPVIPVFQPENAANCTFWALDGAKSKKFRIFFHFTISCMVKGYDYNQDDKDVPNA